MAADLQPSHNHNIPVLLNLDNSITVSLETFPAILTKQMNFGASDSKEKNLSLEDLCKAANSDLLASKSKGKDTKSGLSASSNIQMQSKNSITGFIANVGLTVNEDILSESKQSQISLKDKQSDKYKCEYCGKICAKPSILQKHIRAHTNERPFPCEECGVQFKTKSNLHKHCKSRSHLIHSAQISIQKDAGDKNVEKISSPTFVSSNNNKCDIQENTSSSCDGQDDSNTKPQSSVFFLNQFGNGQVIFKSLGHVVASLNSSNTVHSVSQKNFSECSPDSNISQASSQRPFLKSFSEKGQPKTVHHVKPHSHSFSNEMDLNQIPKLDKTMTSDDIQKRISMIITLNDHIIDTPKEIKNHRFRKFVRDSDYGNASMDSCSGRLVTRSNSITPTLSSDSFLSFTLTSSSVSSKSPTIHNSNFLAAPTNEHIWSFVTNKSSSDSRSTLSTQKIQHFSLPETGGHDANEFRNFTKAHSFGSSQSVLVSRSDSSLRALSVSSDPNVLKFCSRIPLEIISKNACDYDHAHLSYQSTDVNPSLSPAVSPSSSPIHSSDHKLKLKRGRPKGSKNKLKSPVCSATCAQPIVPTIHITSPEDNPPESNCRKELKRLLLMKRSMSNENSSDKNQLVPLPITSTSQASQTTAVSSTLTSCTGIKHLSPSSIPIKKRRKTLTELGRGTAFGTKVDDHNLELGASSKAKNNITKPLWSSDSSFCKSTLLDDIRAQESLENLQRNATITANKSDPKISENTALIDLTETNSKLQICLVDTSAHFSCRPKDLASNLSTISNSEANSSFVTFANEPPQTCDSSLLPLDLLKERYVLIPTHFINQAVALDDNENKAMECSLKTSTLHLSSSSLNHKVGFNSVAATNNVHEDTDTKNMICLDDRCLNVSATESSSQQEMNCNTENKPKHTTNIMHLKFKGCSHLRQTSKIKPVASSSELLDHCTSNLVSIELSKRARVDASLSSNDSLDDCLLRAQMDSEAAASLLDLSKSRRPPSLQDEISMEMSVSHANTISLNELPRSTIASVLQTSEKARHDDHFFSSAGSVIKNYNFVEGKHVCPICQKTFPKEHSLSLHKNVHYMEKPYRCGKCQATFQSNWLLKRHQNIVHHLSKSLYDPRPFKCLECKVAFRTRGHLAKHARSKVHSEKIKSKSAKCISDENDEDGRESYDCIETSSGTHMPSFTPATIQDSFMHNSSMNSGTSQISSQAVSNLYNCDEHQDQFQDQASSPDSTPHKLKQSIEPRSLTLNDLAINEAMLEFHTDENSISQISEAKPKKLSFIGKSRCCDMEQMGTETIFNHTGPTGDLDDVSKSLSQKYLKLQDYQTSLITSNSDASSVKGDPVMFPCRVCSTACEDPLSLLNHYESHLEQRVHICLICDAGFKTQESLNGHLNLHCEKHSLGIQTQENEILDEFLRKCDSSLKIPMMVSPHNQDSLRVLPYLGNHANCLSTVGGDRTFLRLPQSNVSSIVPCLSQKCIMSSGQWALQQSNLHLPANPIQQVTKLQHLEPEVKNNTSPKLSQLITNEGFPATHPASHLLLQPVSISSNISLFPQNTYLLVPSEANKGDTSPNHREVLFFDPSVGCFFAASGRSLIGSAMPITKSLSSLAIPVESHNSIKPV